MPRVQQTINATYHRSIHTTPFELLVGSKIRSKADLRICELLEGEARRQFNDDREVLRKEAKTQISKVQKENKRTYNLRRREPNKYHINDLVAIKRTQFGPGLKMKAKYLGPYHIVRAKYNSYDVRKEGFHEGPSITSTCAEYMKPWCTYEDDVSSRADDKQDGRTVGQPRAATNLR